MGTDPPLLEHPRDYLKPDTTWPDGPPPRVRRIQALAQRIQHRHGGATHKSIAAATGLSVGTIFNLLHGKTWGSARTISTLDAHFEVQAWGTEPRDLSDPPRAYLAPEHDWPDGALLIDAPHEARLGAC